MSGPHEKIIKGRGSHLNPQNRFARIRVEDDFDHLEYDEDLHGEPRSLPTEYFIDNSKSIISENDSPDIPFRYSLNPYRGCAHGCSYCYARPTHEYLGLNAGLDFETKVFVKERAPRLFRDWLSRDAYTPQPVMFSGVTDCYQPAERHFRLTRQCLEVALECRQPINIVTKNALVVRDLDVLQGLAAENLIHVFISVTTLDSELARVMEPRTSTPPARLRAVQTLAEAGIPVGVMAAPIIPGLNDFEIPAILQAAKDAGAQMAAYILLRLPLTVEPVFFEWLERTQPTKKERVESRIRSTRGGKLSESQFGKRMRGTGPIAEQISRTFEVFARRHGLNRKPPPLDTSRFERPQPSSGQMRLF